jgi:hypothetical protein
MGVASLVLGIVGLILCGILGPLAIVFGAMGRSRATQGLATNKGVATAGFVLGIVTTVLWLLAILVNVS